MNISVVELQRVITDAWMSEILPHTHAHTCTHVSPFLLYNSD